MGSALRYWTLVKLDSSGKLRRQEISVVKTFFWQTFPEIDETAPPDLLIQRRLVQVMREAEGRDRGSEFSQDHSRLAELSLRCFISNQIVQACAHLANQFGASHGFTCEELCRYVLHDQGHLGSDSHLSFAREILQSFDPDRSNLSAWTTRLVKHHRELNRFLLVECGIYLLSDWAILNDTKPEKLERVLIQFHHLTAKEVQQARALLESYHAVYRRDRLNQRLAGTAKSHCSPPTLEQLQQMSQQLQSLSSPTLSADVVRTRLQTLAERLRQHRIQVRRGVPTNTSPEIPDLPDKSSEDDDPSNEFLQIYFQQFDQCLLRTCEQVISDRLQRLKPAKQQQFLTALQLFHCQGMTMTEIATQVGLKAQFQVTRLLNLNEFRADVHHHLLKCLHNCVSTLAQDYVNPEQLQQQDKKIEAALNVQVKKVIHDAQTDAHTPKNYSSGSQFSRSLCQYLDGIISF